MEHAGLWSAFALIVVGVLTVDLGVVGRKGRDVGMRKALAMVGIYAALAVAFACAIFLRLGTDAGLEFSAAYLLEQSLSLDNIFVWVLIFQHLQVPEDAQHKVLFWGIIGAMVLRGAFIFAGTALIDAFDWLLYLFGGLVLFSGIRLLRSQEGAAANPADSRILRFMRRHLDLSERYEGARFFSRTSGRLRPTPLFLALLAIETTDFIFALDSIPAIFGVTRTPLVVFTSNVFAILGLRAMYFVVSGLVARLTYLRYGLSLLLILIGGKMMAGHLVEVPVWLTLGATVAVLAGSIGLSLLKCPDPGTRKA